jgi:hypothetical protein
MERVYEKSIHWPEELGLGLRARLRKLFPVPHGPRQLKLRELTCQLEQLVSEADVPKPQEGD